MKSVVSFFLASAIIFSVTGHSASAQNMSKPPVKNVIRQDPNPAPADPLSVAIDAPIPAMTKPPFAFNLPELKFGAQGTAIESCSKITITNMSSSTQTITGIFCDDNKNYTIPTPEQKMMPMRVEARKNFEISVCFKPVKVGEYKTRLVIRTANDSSVLPVSGKGLKPEDMSKLPKNDVIVIKPKKKGKPWTFKLQVIASSKVTMQLFDDLGAMAMEYYTNDLKNEGVYEVSFEGLDKNKKKLPSGNYYLRCIIEDITRTGGQTTKFTKVVQIKD